MNRVRIRPELLRWACERSRIEPAELTRRIPQLAAWERGERLPTLKQLEKFANSTHTPIGLLFLPEPPAESVPIPDFRTIADQPVAKPSADLLETLYLCQQRQEWYRDFARTMGETPLGFVGSVEILDDVVSTAARIRQELGLDLEERRQLGTWTEALRRFIRLADAAGILVMVSGVVGSNNRRKLDPREFRGFALVDELAPLVFINGSDTKAAQMFTLAHELVHLWLGQSALSDSQASSPPKHRVERWCNQVAAEVLVPLVAVREAFDSGAELAGEIHRLARRFKVSTLVILRRIHDAGGFEDSTYWTAFHAELERLHSLPRGSGGNFYLTLGARVSRRFARALVVSTLEGRSSFTESFRLLGFKKMATFRELGHSLGIPV